MSTVRDAKIYQHMAAGSDIGKFLLLMVEENWDEWVDRHHLLCRKSKHSAEEVFLSAVWSIGMYDNWFPWHESRMGFGMCIEIFVLNQWLVELCVRSGSKIFSDPQFKPVKNFY